MSYVVKIKMETIRELVSRKELSMDAALWAWNQEDFRKYRGKRKHEILQELVENRKALAALKYAQFSLHTELDELDDPGKYSGGDENG